MTYSPPSYNKFVSKRKQLSNLFISGIEKVRTSKRTPLIFLSIISISPTAPAPYEVLHQISGNEPLLLSAGTGSDHRYPGLLPDAEYYHKWIHIIAVKTRLFNFLNTQVSGQLMDNRTDDFQMCQFFRACIGIDIAHLQNRYFAFALLFSFGYCKIASII